MSDNVLHKGIQYPNEATKGKIPILHFFPPREKQKQKTMKWGRTNIKCAFNYIYCFCY